MKLELDLSSRTALNRQKQVLTQQRADIDRALKIVEIALSEAPNEQENPNAAQPSINGEANADIFGRMPSRFRIGNLLSGYPDLTRRQARELIQQWEDERRVRVVERIRGNRGNTYEKIQ